MLKFIPAREQDEEEIADLYYAQFGRDPGNHNIRSLILTYPSMVAYEDRNILGFVLTDFFAPDTLRLDTILVREDHRRKGIGTALLNSLFSTTVSDSWMGMLASDCKIMWCEGKTDNTAFFENNYFLKIAETPDTVLFFSNIR